MSIEILVCLIVLALAFDFMNGFHDAANSIATIVSTGAMRPQYAIVWAAFFNFIAFLFFGLHVAGTVGKGIIDPLIVDHYVVFGALMGATSWNIITWYYGIPSSSSHALIGGLAGAAVAKGGTGTLVGSGFMKTAAAILISPALGFLLGAGLMVLISWLFVRSTPRRVGTLFNSLQFVSAALYSLGHGSNDAQKTMGIIWMLLIASSTIGPSDDLPFWVILVCQLAMGLGTLFGGWRIVKTMGMRITKLKPVSGFAASASGAATLFLATGLGVPVSTTHTITGAIVGVGASQKLSAVRWGVAGNIVWAWIFTIPGSAFIAAVSWWFAQHFF
ncbi:MAG: anion permease [Betaproteobacteria bacterium]|jgi:inorganic phosphate transporter, PiT family|nr:anion permease [Betaproteobacteria bacterium]